MSEETSLTERRSTIQAYEFSTAEVVAQVEKVQDLIKRVMRKGEHYGTIKGCGPKPTLLKAGAEKIGFTFRLTPEFEIERNDFVDGHREYSVICKLTHVPTGMFMGQGVGTCSTMEAKYRFRSENTGALVPKEYWQSRDQDLLGGPSYFPRKVKNTWVIFHRVEHDNPADYYNTILKMAKKRAHVDSIITATAASDLFTQDVEDLADNGVIGEDVIDAEIVDEEAPAQEPQRASAAGMSELDKKKAFRDAVLEKLGQKSISQDKCRAIFDQVTQLSYLTDPLEAARWVERNANIDKNGVVTVVEESGSIDDVRAELESFCICCCAAAKIPATDDYKTWRLDDAPGLEDRDKVAIALSTFKNKDGKVITGKKLAYLSDKAAKVALAKARKLSPDLLVTDS